ncbi:unnamed protein product, partial [Effrenium voratum]
ALAAMGLALSAAASDPLDPTGQTAATRVANLQLRLLEMADEKPIDEDVPVERKRTLAAERDVEQRCGVVWSGVIVRRMAQQQLTIPALLETTSSLSRAFARSISGLSMFVADCGLKSLCNLYRLVPAESRPELLKGIFSSISHRTVVSNMFVGTPETQARKEEQDKKEGGGPNSWKIAAKERVDQVKDLMFLARELGHPALFIGLLDQPAGSVWTGEIMREAVDLQAACLPEELQKEVCPVALRPKLYTYLFYPNAALRQAVVALMANYFSCESPQALSSKHPEEWPLLAKNLVLALGHSRATTREAAIQAAQVLFRGREWREVSCIFEDLWTITVKLMDDMEERIQAVVKPFVRMMRNLTLRLCDVKVSSRKDVETAMNEIMPLLLRFCERYKHAQPICFEIMRELIKASHGALLEPHVQNLVPPLLVSLSMMENDALQYYQFHISAKSEEKGKELEAARISNSRDSESMKLLRQLVPYINQDVAEALAPRTRELLHRGVGANTRVGVCDFWVAVCAERTSAVLTGGSVASSMLRSVAGALLDPSREVRGAAASCFASFARRNAPQELTKVIFERLLKQDQEYRTDDVQRNSYRVSLARALWEVCRRCDDNMLEPELKAAVASKAFSLRWSIEAEVKTGRLHGTDVPMSSPISSERKSGLFVAAISIVHCVHPSLDWTYKACLQEEAQQVSLIALLQAATKGAQEVELLLSRLGPASNALADPKSLAFLHSAASTMWRRSLTDATLDMGLKKPRLKDDKFDGQSLASMSTACSLSQVSVRKREMRQAPAHHLGALVTTKAVESFQSSGVVWSKELVDLSFPFVIADPSCPKCPVVLCSQGFSSLSARPPAEVVGTDLIQLGGAGHVGLEAANTVETLIQSSRDGQFLPEGSVCLNSCDRMSAGEVLFSITGGMVILKQVLLDDDMFIIGVLDKKSEPDCDMSRQLSTWLDAAVTVLAAEYFYSAPLRRQVADGIDYPDMTQR